MIIFNNIDNISEERFEYIKKRIITFLSIIFDSEHKYSDILSKIDIVRTIEDVEISGYFDAFSKSITIENLENNNDLDSIIIHELNHVKFKKNNAYDYNYREENTYDEKFIGCYFLDEFNSRYQSYKLTGLSFEKCIKIKEDYKKIIELYDTNFKKVLSKIRKIHGDEKILSNPKVIDILKAEKRKTDRKKIYNLANYVACEQWLYENDQCIIDDVKINILVNEISVMNFDKINEGDIKFVATFVKNILSLGQ